MLPSERLPRRLRFSLIADNLTTCLNNVCILTFIVSVKLVELDELLRYDIIMIKYYKTKARFPLPELTARVDGYDRFPFPVNTGRQLGPSTRLVETGLKLHKIISYS